MIPSGVASVGLGTLGLAAGLGLTRAFGAAARRLGPQKREHSTHRAEAAPADLERRQAACRRCSWHIATGPRRPRRSDTVSPRPFRTMGTQMVVVMEPVQDHAARMPGCVIPNYD